MQKLITTLTTIGLLALFVILFTHIHLPSNNTPQTATVLTATEIKAKIADLKAQLATVAPVTTPSYNFTRNLTVGSKGDDVLELQTFLKSKGYLTITTPTTYFGPLTRTALGKWQAANNISPSAGYFGPLTRTKINASSTSTTNTQASSIQAQIDALNSQLATLEGSTVTHPYNFTRTLTVGSRGDDVTTLQTFLIQKGYLTTTPSGYFGEQTKTALAKWQTDQSISPAAGYFGPTTIQTINNITVTTTVTPTTPAPVTPTPVTPQPTTIQTDFTAPVISNGTPILKTLPSTTTTTTLSVTTDEAATCKFSQNFNPYSAMESTFEVTGGTTHTSTASGLQSGHSYVFYVQCRDTAGNTNTTNYTLSFSIDGVALGTGGGGATVTSSGGTDTTAPVRSSGLPSGTLNAGTTTTNITLATNEASTCRYATQPNTTYLSMTLMATTGTTTHSSSVSGLQNSSSYIYYVKCKDTTGNTSPDDYPISFSVAAPGTPPDTTPPTVSITAPTSGTQSGTISVTATASDNTSVSGVQFKLDGNNLSSEDTSSPYSISWNTTTATNASHVLMAVARDAASNTTTSSPITITVNNDTSAPVLSGGAPSGTLTTGTTSTTLSVTTDEAATCKYGTSAGTTYGGISNTFTTTGGMSHSQSVTGLSNGTSYTYYVRCSDAIPNVNTSDYMITFSVSAGAGVAYSGNVTLSGGGNVSGGVVQVLNGSNNVVATGSISGGSYSIPTGSLSGSYTLKLQPPLQYSLGTGEPDTVTSVAVGSTRNFTVKPAMYSDDFQSYTDITQITSAASPSSTTCGSSTPGHFFYGTNLQMSGCSNPQKMFLDNGGPNGTKALRYDWDAKPWDHIEPIGDPNSGYCSHETTIGLDPRFNPPPTIASVWVRFTTKESPSFEHGSQDCMGHAGLSYKFFHTQVYSGNIQARFGSYLENALSGIAGNSSLPTIIATDMNDFQGHVVQTGSYNLGSTWGGSFHTWVMEITNISTSTGSPTTYKMYLDGNVIDTKTAATFLPGSTIGPGWALSVDMGANINNGPDHAQSRWWSDIGIYSSRPSLIIQ